MSADAARAGATSDPGYWDRTARRDDRAALLLNSGALYPFFGVLLRPLIASAAMSLSSVSVIGNALRLRRASLDERLAPHRTAARA